MDTPHPSIPAVTHGRGHAGTSRDRSGLALALAIAALVVSLVTGIGTVLAPLVIGFGLFGLGHITEGPSWAGPGLDDSEVASHGGGHVSVEPGAPVRGASLADQLRIGLAGPDPSAWSISCPDVPEVSRDVSVVCRGLVEGARHRIVVAFDGDDGDFTFVDLAGTD